MEQEDKFTIFFEYLNRRTWRSCVMPLNFLFTLLLCLLEMLIWFWNIWSGLACTSRVKNPSWRGRLHVLRYVVTSVLWRVARKVDVRVKIRLRGS